MAITINGTTGIAGVDGSASTPAVQGTDTNTGIFFPAADTIAFGEGGTESMRINSDGKVLIGASSSDLSGTSQALVIGSGGLAVQFGGSTGTYLKVNPGNANGIVELVADARTGNYPDMTFKTSSTERARITSGGDFVLGATTNSGYNFRVSAGNKYAAGFENSSGNIPITCQIVSGSGSQTFITFYNGTTNTGYINTTGTNTLYTSISDYRLKENIAPMTGALATVAQLKPCTYTWKADGSDGQGFIAHELQAVVPDCVTGEKDAVDADGNPKYQGIDTSFLVATLTAAIQELKAELDTTKARLAALEAK